LYLYNNELINEKEINKKKKTKIMDSTYANPVRNNKLVRTFKLFPQ
jgi:hypothetical protein